MAASPCIVEPDGSRSHLKTPPNIFSMWEKL